MSPDPKQKGSSNTRSRSREHSAEAVQRRAVYQIKAEFFRILGHPVRVRILELLRDGERTVGDLQDQLQLDSSGTSQHLGALRKQGILDSRRDGTSVYYSVRDPRIFQLLEVARQILNTNLTESQAILGELATPS
ncbi:MAG: ArsR/SmtB family transcription factor [Solirubrobacteraceae bacterium]